MAEEPLLVNFSLGNSSILVQPKFRGGRWKDRRNLKKQSHQDDENPTEPPAKRPRTQNSYKSPSAGSRQKTIDPRHGVVSSLFSFNPEIQSTPNNSEPQPLAEPSNAPLIDGIDTFTTLGLNQAIAAHLLSKLQIKAPTAVQKVTIPQLIREDADAFVQAETGSGKTLAYLLPIVHQLMQMSERRSKGDTDDSRLLHRDSGLFAIILAPTRELSKQISVVLESLLGCARWIVSGTVVGGEKKKSEKARLRKGLNILVATPGRLVDHLQHTEVLDVSKVRWLVLDEGDRLMELGFEDDLKKILAKLESKSNQRTDAIPGLPSKRVTILCSATMRTNVHKLGELSLKNAVHLQASAEEQDKSEQPISTKSTFSAPAQLQQSYIVAPPKQRLVTLYAVLKRSFSRKESVMKAIVFFTCADSVDFHYEAFARKTDQAENVEKSTTISELPTVCYSPVLSSVQNPDITLYKLYGDLSQQTRTATLKAFAQNSDPAVLLCTDVASRGLDLPFIDLVIQYDPAFSAEEHLHRIGRTARAGRAGQAVVFLQPGPEESYIPILNRGNKDKQVDGSSSEDILRKAFAPAIASRSKESWGDRATEWQLEVERWIQMDDKMADLARKAYISHVRAYATHTLSERSIFDVKELHLGHLAKAFGLRDKPSNMGRGGQVGDSRGQGTSKHKNNRNGNGYAADFDTDIRHSANDPREAANQMRKALQAMNPASEFNIA